MLRGTEAEQRRLFPEARLRKGAKAQLQNVCTSFFEQEKPLSGKNRTTKSIGSHEGHDDSRAHGIEKEGRDLRNI